MNIDQFDFNLPEDLIAQQPVNPRHNSKLLSCINSELGDFHFYDLPNLLNPGDVIVVNAVSYTHLTLPTIYSV